MLFDDKELLGKIIRNYRKRKNLTQAELAEKVGLCEKHIGQIERGAYMPTLINFFKIIQTLEINLSEFGLNTNKDITNPVKNEILRIIYGADDKELTLYLNIISGAHKYLVEQTPN